MIQARLIADRILFSAWGVLFFLFLAIFLFPTFVLVVVQERRARHIQIGKLKPGESVHCGNCHRLIEYPEQFSKSFRGKIAGIRYGQAFCYQFKCSGGNQK